jgi:hypothetical protein
MIDTTTCARGRKSLKVTALSGQLTSSAFPIASNPLPEPSLHLDFRLIDTFDTYSSNETDEGVWYAYLEWGASQPLGTSVIPAPAEYLSSSTSLNNGETFPFSAFARRYEDLVDLSTYSGLSIHGRASGDVCLYMSFMDFDGVQSEWMKLGYLPKRWSRIDASISWGDCDSSNVEWVLYHYDASGDSVFWLDEMLLYDCEAGSKYTNWIPMYGTEASTKRKGSINAEEIAGKYPSIIHSSTPESIRGRFTFRSEFAQMDDELRFVRYCMRSHSRVFFRAGAEGWPIYLVRESNAPMLSHGGYKTEITTEFVEAT